MKLIIKSLFDATCLITFIVAFLFVSIGISAAVGYGVYFAVNEAFVLYGITIYSNWLTSSSVLGFGILAGVSFFAAFISCWSDNQSLENISTGAKTDEGDESDDSFRKGADLELNKLRGKIATIMDKLNVENEKELVDKCIHSLVVESFYRGIKFSAKRYDAIFKKIYGE